MLRPGYNLCDVAARPTSADDGAFPGKVLPPLMFVEQN